MQQERLFAVILAGGKGSRIENPDKPLIKLSSTPLIELCLQKIQDKVAQVVLSINHNPEKYIHLNSTVVKEVSELGGDISQYVPKIVQLSLNTKFQK